PLFLDRPEEELEALARERELAFFDEQFLRIMALRPRVVVPYSYTNTYSQPDQLQLNGYARMPPSLFANAFRARQSSTECWVLQPGDVIDTATDTVESIRPESLWGSDLPEFLQNIKSYSESIQGTLPSLDPEEPECC